MAVQCHVDGCDDDAIGYIIWSGSGDAEMDANTPEGEDQPVCKKHKDTEFYGFPLRPLER